MSPEETKTKGRRLIEEVWNQKNLEVCDEIFAADVISHGPTGTSQGVAAQKQFISAYLAAFPDLHFTIEAQMSEAEMSATRWTGHGTHQGPLAGIPPTGIQTTNSGITMSHWVNGKIVEIWSFFDNLSLMQQLGVIPARLE
jgi:steroid delta-isomerase-like uncharacterized protein